jgi:predicted nucleic acid-binding protein
MERPISSALPAESSEPKFAVIIRFNPRGTGMNLYVDTSALIKKYVKEPGSDQVVSFFRQFPIVGTASLTQAEIASAMSKAARLGWVDESEISIAWKDFLTHWSAYSRLPVSSGIIEKAATLCWRHSLRAYDAIHLASALSWNDLSGGEVIFACYDKSLKEAAKREGMQVWPEATG